MIFAANFKLINMIIHCIVLVCVDLSDKEPHRQVGVDKVMALGSLGGEMVFMLSPEWQYVCVLNLL